MRIALVVGIALVMLALGGCGLAEPPGGPSGREKGGEYLLDHTSTWDGHRISGTVINLGLSRVSCVYVEYGLRDKFNRTIKTVSAKKSSGLSPSQQWEFKIMASAVEATSRVLTKLAPC